jgi:hypothetical protein
VYSSFPYLRRADAEWFVNPLEYATSLGEGGKIDESVSNLDRLYSNPENHTILHWISELYERNGRMKEAIEFAELFLVSGEVIDDDYIFKRGVTGFGGLWLRWVRRILRRPARPGD